MKEIIRKTLPDKLFSCLVNLKNNYLDGYSIKSYSQEGEDMILRRIFEKQQVGFYVDVGAHHPRRFSNTYFFYKRGWRGINIEPNPDVSRLFQSARPRDINLQLGVSDTPGSMTYYQFDETALNTFDSEIVNSRLVKTDYKLISTREVDVARLDQILNNYLPTNTKPDYFSIDVEGFDLVVLKSNDWKRFRPTCVLVEEIGTSVEDVMHSEIFKYMNEQQYLLVAKTYNTLIFLDETTHRVT